MSNLDSSIHGSSIHANAMNTASMDVQAETLRKNQKTPSVKPAHTEAMNSKPETPATNPKENLKGVVKSPHSENLSFKTIKQACARQLKSLLSNFKTSAKETVIIAPAAGPPEGPIKELLDIKQSVLNKTAKNPSEDSNPNQTLRLLENNLKELNTLTKTDQASRETNELQLVKFLPKTEDRISTMREIRSEQSLLGKQHQQLKADYQKAIDKYKSFGATGAYDAPEDAPASASKASTSVAKDEVSIARDVFNVLDIKMARVTSKKNKPEERLEACKDILTSFIKSKGDDLKPFQSLGIPDDKRDDLNVKLSNAIDKKDIEGFVHIIKTEVEPFRPAHTINAERLPGASRPETNSIFKSSMKTLGENLKELASQIIQHSHLDRIVKEGAPILSRQTSDNETFSSFDLKSNIPIDRVTINGEKKLYANLTADERLTLDKQKFSEVQKFLQNIPADLSDDHKQECVAEVLSKVLAYISPQAMGDSLQIPDANGKLVEYQIERKNLANSNLPYFVFTPPANENDAKAWLVIRGTDANIVGKSITNEERKSAMNSLVADFAKSKGLATAPVDNAFDEIKEFLDDHPGCQLAGHSLGGIIQHLGVKASAENYEIGTIFAFNSPGVSKETRNMYNALENKPDIKCFDKRGDFIPSAGRYLIGDHYRVKQGSSRPDVAHRELDSNKESTLQLIDNAKEEAKGVRRLTEGLRSTLGPATIGTATRIAGAIKGKDYMGVF